MNSWPLYAQDEMRQLLYRELGEDPYKSDLKLQRKLNRIIKRGKIVNRDEYDLVQSFSDRIFSNAAGESLSPDDTALVQKYDDLLENADFEE